MNQSFLQKNLPNYLDVYCDLFCDQKRYVIVHNKNTNQYHAASVPIQSTIKEIEHSLLCTTPEELFLSSAEPFLDEIRKKDCLTLVDTCNEEYDLLLEEDKYLVFLGGSRILYNKSIAVEMYYHSKKKIFLLCENMEWFRSTDYITLWRACIYSIFHTSYRFKYNRHTTFALEPSYGGTITVRFEFPKWIDWINSCNSKKTLLRKKNAQMKFCLNQKPLYEKQKKKQRDQYTQYMTKKKKHIHNNNNNIKIINNKFKKNHR